MDDWHVQVPATVTFIQVMNLYNERVIEIKYHLFSKSVKSVKYPLEASFILDKSHLNLANGQLNVIQEINVSNIGHHMQYSDFNLDHIQKKYPCYGIVIIKEG